MSEQALVALSPGEMPAAQSAITAWCERQRQSLDAELGDLRDHLLIAKANGWKLTGVQGAIARTERRQVYYAKVKAAVEAGYLIVPNLPVTVMAVRVRKDASQPRRTQDASWHATFRTPPELLPAGDGRYVDDTLQCESYSVAESDGKGGTKRETRYRSTSFDDSIDFPFLGVKPVVMSAAARAMALKLFDQIGIVQNQSGGKDPILVGQILGPNTRGSGRLATFFLAWWLNVEDL